MADIFNFEEYSRTVCLNVKQKKEEGQLAETWPTKLQLKKLKELREKLEKLNNDNGNEGTCA